MEPFGFYPGEGRELLGQPNRTDNCRHGYGIELQKMTGLMHCAYCGVSLVDDYYRWLLMVVDHVVSVGEAKRLGIQSEYRGDFINMVLCCAGCNGFNPRYKVEREPQSDWTVAEFVALRDQVFADRSQLIAKRRAEEIAYYNGKPWENH